MNIQLINWKITNLVFSILEDNEKREKNSFNLNTAKWFPDEENGKSFFVAFRLEIKDKKFDLTVHVEYLFELSEPITDEFKKSTFPTVNAPAIAFPYLRSFVSNLTLQAGFSPVILPSINFVKLAEEAEEEEKEKE